MIFVRGETFLVIPANAGTQGRQVAAPQTLDRRFRGGDGCSFRTRRP